MNNPQQCKVALLRCLQRHPWIRRATLFLGMYSITAGVIWYESGSLTVGLTFGLFSSTLKTGWALAHAWLHDMEGH